MRKTCLHCGGRFSNDYWYAFLFWIVLLLLLEAGYRLLRTNFEKSFKSWKYSVSGILVLVLAVGRMIEGMRVGFRHNKRPITISNAARYVPRPEQVAIVLNTPFAILRTIDKQTYGPVHIF